MTGRRLGGYFIWIALFLAIIAGAVFLGRGKSDYFRSANASSFEDRSDFAMLSQPHSWSDAGFGAAIDEITVGSGEESDSVKVTAPAYSRLSPLFVDAVVSNDDPGDPWRVDLSGGGSVTLTEIQVRWDTDFGWEDKAIYLPGEENPRPASEDAAFPNPRRSEKSKDASHWGSRRLWFRFACDEADSAQMELRGLWDPRTCRPVSGMFGGSRGKGRVGWDFTTWYWSDDPLVLAFDAVSGKTEEVEVAAAPGSVAEFRKCRFKILAVETGKRTGSSKRQGDPDLAPIDWWEFKIDPAETDQTTIILAQSHPANSYMVRVDGIDSAGSVLPGTVLSEPRFLGVTFPVARSELKALRFSRAASCDRVIFRTPQIPGTPLANRDRKNLSEVRIPILRVRSASHFRGLLIGGLQARINPSAEFPGNYFPKDYRDVSYGELLAEFDQFTPGLPLEIDPKEWAVRPREPSIVSQWWRKFRRKWSP